MKHVMWMFVLCCLLAAGCHPSSRQTVTPENLEHIFDSLDLVIGRYADSPVPEIPTALRYADTLIALTAPYASNKKYNLLYARAYVRKGDVLLVQKQYNEACLLYYLAKKSLLPSADSCSYASLFSSINSRLANVSYLQGRYKEAAAVYLAALHFIRRCDHGFHRYYSIQGTLDNIGLCYSAMGNSDSALYYYSEALAFLHKEEAAFPAKKQFTAVAKAVVYGNQGTAWLLKGDTTRAEQAFLQNIAINGQKGYAEQDALITRVKLAAIYVYTKRLKLADSLLQVIHASPLPLTDRYRVRLLQVEADYAMALNKPVLANQYLQQYIREKNSWDTANSSLMGTNLQQELNLLHQNYEVLMLKRQTQLTYAYLFLALLLFGLMIVILYVSVRGRRQARKHALESQQHSEQLELMLRALEKSNHEHAELMRVVAHDLKNPLSVIYMLTELMTVQEGKPAEDLEMLQLIRGASTNMNTVIQELLAGKNAPDTSSTRREEADIRTLLQQSVDLLRYRANKKNQRLIAAKHPACMVHINYEQIWRVINNLLVNAIKFSPEHTTISVEWVVLPTEVVIQVQDQGIGIPPELHEQIFEQFSAAQRAGTSGEQPFGMGLYISRQIVEAHDGRIWVESVVGRGTTFFVALRR